MTIRYRVLPEKAAFIFSYFGSQQAAEAQFISYIKGQLLAELERHSIAEARQSKIAIADKVENDLQEVIQEDYGYALLDIIIQEIIQL